MTKYEKIMGLCLASCKTRCFIEKLVLGRCQPFTSPIRLSRVVSFNTDCCYAMISVYSGNRAKFFLIKKSISVVFRVHVIVMKNVNASGS